MRHVIWIWFENATYDRIIGAPGSKADRTQPYFNAVARACASLTHMSAVQHASLGNYIAAATGSPAGIHGGCDPSACPIDRPSIFEQVSSRGGSWRSYQQSLPSPCLGRDDGRYAVRHDPVPYLTRIRGACAAGDVPLGSIDSGPLADDIATDSLPTFAMVTPDLCSDGHDCPEQRADAWLRRWLPQLVHSSAYARGEVAIFVTWDEGDRGRAPGVASNAPCPADALRADCHIATLAIAPTIPSGTRISTRLDHVDILQATERMLGLPTLGPRRSTASSLLTTLRISQPKLAATGD
ncbi:MAG: hypothetical protein H7287_02990 [Thermoleophilia bacterium]|nr:hypothetical protein [Thermoleophilia bacterium]